MKNILSLLTCLLICIVLLAYRVTYPGIKTDRPLKVTEWDVFGYYLYLPSTLIYHDYKKLTWMDSVDHRYQLSGGTGYPVQQADNGNFVNKYFGGVALMQLPFFAIGHCAAKFLGYRPDGYSPPYQYALGFGIILYCFLATLVLRRVLLIYFNDFVAAFTLLLICLATNFIQYAAVDNGQSHAYLFVLYALILYATIRWHERPTAGWAIAVGFILGLATLCRPTEAIMLFISLLWGTATKEAAKEKWAAVSAHKGHVLLATVAGLLALTPQLIYWKLVSDSWVYDVGSKWQFLTPWFRVLFGFEKGWFIYTPITIFFMIGFFFMNGFPFRKAVLTFCLLNIWIIIAWDDWQYGGSYSTRALVQSYPVFALPLASLIDRARLAKWRFLFYPVAVYLLGVNLFQVTQYCTTILHYREMNRNYYSHIYLNPDPEPLDMSLMDTQEFISDESDFKRQTFLDSNRFSPVHFTSNGQQTILEKPLNGHSKWIRINAVILAPHRLWLSHLNADLKVGDSIKHTKIRLFSPVGERTNRYEFYMKVPDYFAHAQLRLYISSAYDFDGTIKRLNIFTFE